MAGTVAGHDRYRYYVVLRLTFARIEPDVVRMPSVPA
jgi:hypothetical protein